MTEVYWTLIGVLLGAVITGLFSYLLLMHQLKHNKEMFLLQNRSKEMVKDILNDMLNHKDHIDRSFDALSRRIGGYTDDEIKQLLHEIGAIRVIRSEDNSEWWYLKEREGERIAKRSK